MEDDGLIVRRLHRGLPVHHRLTGLVLVWALVGGCTGLVCAVIQEWEEVCCRASINDVGGESTLDRVLDIRGLDRSPVVVLQAVPECVGELGEIGIRLPGRGCHVRHNLGRLLRVWCETHQISRIEALQIPAKPVIRTGRVPRIAVATCSQLDRPSLRIRRIHDCAGGEVEPGSGTARAATSAVVISATAGSQEQRAGSSDGGKLGRTPDIYHCVDPPPIVAFRLPWWQPARPIISRNGPVDRRGRVLCTLRDAEYPPEWVVVNS